MTDLEKVKISRLCIEIKEAIDWDLVNWSSYQDMMSEIDDLVSDIEKIAES